jgi:hypothetical protein
MKLTATFSNGHTITRNSKKDYSHAYLVKNQWQTFTGFASSEEKARKSATMQHGTIELVEIVSVTKED